MFKVQLEEFATGSTSVEVEPELNFDFPQEGACKICRRKGDYAYDLKADEWNDVLVDYTEDVDEDSLKREVNSRLKKTNPVALCIRCLMSDGYRDVLRKKLKKVGLILLEDVSLEDVPD